MDGPLWCDEGLFCIAKELQLLKPTKLVLVLWRVYFEKIVIAW